MAPLSSERLSSTPPTEKLEYGRAGDFHFCRFQSPVAVKAALAGCRPSSSFKLHRGKDGRHGFVSTAKLGGDWVLAESEQVAPSCTCEEVARAYITAHLQQRWNADKVARVTFSRKTSPSGVRYYQQDISLLSQRVIRSHTGPMSYSQTITVDKVGRKNFCVSVLLDPNCPATARKPFESLDVYVGLEQQQDDVRIYAAGVFEVNRRVVPNLIVFDASGIAGDMAGKGTLWLAGHFEERRAAAAAAMVGKATWLQGARARLEASRRPESPGG